MNKCVGVGLLVEDGLDVSEHGCSEIRMISF